MKENKGITLMSLVITIIILLILSGITFQTGKSVIENSKVTAFTVELQAMQTKVNELYQKKNSGDGTTNINGEDVLVDDIGTALTGSQEENTALAGAGVSSDGFKYYSLETIKELGVNEVTQDFLINIDTRQIVSIEGIDYQGQHYYTMDDLPNGLYNVN